MKKENKMKLFNAKRASQSSFTERREGHVPTAVWVVTRAGCDGDNSDAVRGRGGAILGPPESCVYIEQITRSVLYLDTRPHQDNAAINWSLGSCWPADNFIFVIVYEKFFWFSICSCKDKFN